MACLVVTYGKQAGQYFQLGNRTLAGGRDPAREIQITDSAVSRKHFLIRKEGDTHVVVELKAKNGVFVNGQRYQEKTLADGDEIQVGKTILVYRVEDQSDRTDALQQFRKGQREFREDRTLSQ